MYLTIEMIQGEAADIRHFVFKDEKGGPGNDERRI
jgi:hypothetical protein